MAGAGMSKFGRGREMAVLEFGRGREFHKSMAKLDYLLRIRWNIVIVKTIRGYKNKGPLLKVGTPDIILSKLKVDFKF